MIPSLSSVPSRHQIVAMIAGLLLLLALSACNSVSAASEPYVDLSKREPLPVTAPSQVRPLRMAVAAIISPRGNAESYAELGDYLGERLGRPVEMVQRRTYAETNELVAERKVDIAFVCTSAYIAGHDTFGMQLLVAPQINGELVYYSELIVSAENPARSMADLQGKSFAFTDPMSFSGRVYPTYLVQQLGYTPEEFFSNVFFTYSHDRAIESVAAGIADGAAVDSLVLEYLLKRKPDLRDRIKIIQRSPAFGVPPVVVPPEMPPRQVALLREALLTMHENAQGRAILADLGIDRFVTVTDEVYDGVRKLVRETTLQ